jgi:hypothetical protein
VATVPVVYLIGLELRGRRAGLMAAALAAVNPMLLWYSQEARAYSLLALLCAVSLLLAGCGGDDAKNAVSQTAGKLRYLHSGDLNLKLLVTPRGVSSAEPYGFELRGPFTLGSNFAADMTYTQIANGKRATAQLKTENGSGTIESNGTTHALTSAEIADLRVAAAEATGSGGSFLPIQDWVQGAKLTRCGADECVTGELDVVRAANDLLGLGRALGRDLPTIRGADADRLERSARAATFSLVTGKKDRLLRDLTIHIDLGLDVPRSLQAALGSLVGAAFDLELKIDRPTTVA